MGKNSAIEWTDHTFNPWWGCMKISPACANCYAATSAARWRPDVQLWGPGSIRQVASDRAWNEPLRWNRAAEKAGVRARVFCASMADVFEDLPELEESRYRLARLIASTRSLDWLLLTKRPENVMRLATEGRLINSAGRLDGNVWLGTTVEDQQRADERIPALMEVPARVRFLSCEPLLGPIDLERWLYAQDHAPPRCLDWIIAGGESGPGARPMHPDWARSLRDQAVAAGVSFHFKQWGAWAPVEALATLDEVRPLARDERWLNDTGGHGFHGEAVWRMRCVGKGAAGRELDGRTWDEFPRVRR